MQIRPHAPTTAAMLLGGIAALHALLGFGMRQPPPADDTARMAIAPAFGSSGRIVLERCRENVGIIHDVYWAAACLATPDDSPECTLPTARAQDLNASRATAEARCFDEALAAERAPQ